MPIDARPREPSLPLASQRAGARWNRTKVIHAIFPPWVLIPDPEASTKIDAPLKPGDRRRLAEGLVLALSGSVTLAVKTQAYGWNVTGLFAAALHPLFADIQRNLFEAVDELAARIRVIGMPAPSAFSQFAILSNVLEEDEPQKNRRSESCRHGLMARVGAQAYGRRRPVRPVRPGSCARTSDRAPRDRTGSRHPRQREHPGQGFPIEDLPNWLQLVLTGFPLQEAINHQIHIDDFQDGFDCMDAGILWHGRLPLATIAMTGIRSSSARGMRQFRPFFPRIHVEP